MSVKDEMIEVENTKKTALGIFLGQMVVTIRAWMRESGCCEECVAKTENLENYLRTRGPA